MAGADSEDAAEPELGPGGDGRPAGPGGAERSVGWTSAVMAIAAALLLLFNAQSIRGWTATQAPGPLSLAARGVAESWWATTARLGLAAPRAAISDLWVAAQAASWTPLGEAALRPACGGAAMVGPAPSGPNRSTRVPAPRQRCGAPPGQR
jgi:hypothetical protein